MSKETLRTEEANFRTKKHRREIANALAGGVQCVIIFESTCQDKPKRRFQFLEGITGNEEMKKEKAIRRAEREMRQEEKIVKLFWLTDIYPH